MKNQYFEQRGLYYRINDFQQNRQTVVFVHGISGSSSAWIPYEKILNSDFNILSLDLRGHGRSCKPSKYEDYKIEKLADDIYELVEFLKIRKFILIGHSLGSFVALTFLEKHQMSVSKMILLAPNFSIKKMLSTKIVIPFLRVAISLVEALPFSGNPGKHIDYSLYQNSGDWNVLRMFADIRNTSLRVYLYSTRQACDFDGENILLKIHVPVLIIHGKMDTICPVGAGVLMTQKIANARILVLDKADHMLVFNNSEEIVNEIKKFVL